jgi:ribonuclease P protein component
LGYFSFTKADRVLKRSEFIHLSKAGKKLQNRYFIFTFSHGQGDRSRLGVTVTKKVGSSVKRNRIKRLSREYFRLNRHRLKGNWDINIIAKKEAVGLPSDRIFASLDDLFNSISRIHEH